MRGLDLVVGTLEVLCSKVRRSSPAGRCAEGNEQIRYSSVLKLLQALTTESIRTSWNEKTTYC